MAPTSAYALFEVIAVYGLTAGREALMAKDDDEADAAGHEGGAAAT